TVDNLITELSPLALELEFLAARRAEKIGDRLVVRKLRHLCTAAVWAIRPCLDPSLRPRTSALRAACVSQLRFFEAELHSASVAIVYRNASAANALPPLPPTTLSWCATA